MSECTTISWRRIEFSILYQSSETGRAPVRDSGGTQIFKTGTGRDDTFFSGTGRDRKKFPGWDGTGGLRNFRDGRETTEISGMRREVVSPGNLKFVDRIYKIL